jgi:acetyl-CoA C-acetyltransferase
MTDAVILSACRTAIGTAFRGSLTETSAFDLAEVVVAEALRRSSLEAKDIDDIVLGEGLYGGGVIARYVAITQGMVQVPGMSVNRHCAAGLGAVQVAAADIRAGMADAVIAGGTNSASTSPTNMYRTPGTEDVERWMPPTHPETPDAPTLDMSITVGWNTAVEAGISREAMDAWALRSHQRAIAAIDDGRFLDEIVPMKVTRKDGQVVQWEVDEHPRRTSSAEKMAELKVLHPEIPGFSITAGNAAGANDAAAALTLASSDLAEQRGLVPLATIRSWASVGVEPARTGMAPIQAIPAALDRAGLTIGDVSLFEINEAFASVPVATCRALDLDEDIVNVFGSGCSLGHPVAATGARMLATMSYELRRRGGGIGVASMCAGGGMGSAMVIEVAG